MDFIRYRVEESAKAAASAARQLSSLDEMAQSDHYIQSDGLRVSDKKKPPSASSSFSDNSPSVVEDLSGRFVDALSMAARKHNRPRPMNGKPHSPHHHEGSQSTLDRDQGGKSKENNKIIQRKSVTQRPKSKSVTPTLISSVAELYDQNDKKRSTFNQSTAATAKESPRPSTNNELKHSGGGGESFAAKTTQSTGQKTNVLLVDERHAHILHELDYDSDSDTDSSHDEAQAPSGVSQNVSADLEMGRLDKATALHDQLEHELEESISRQNSLNGPGMNDNKQKDVHRFMKMADDLEREREALLLHSVPESTPTSYADSLEYALSQYPPRRGTAGEETGSALVSWIRGVASPQLESVSRQIMTKVSPKAGQSHQMKSPMIGPRHIPPTAKNDIEPERITVASSAAFLADEDMAQLERMRSSPSSKVIALIHACFDNPRLAFIGVTLLLALFAYFFSRHRSVDDVL